MPLRRCSLVSRTKVRRHRVPNSPRGPGSSIQAITPRPAARPQALRRPPADPPGGLSLLGPAGHWGQPLRKWHASAPGRRRLLRPDKTPARARCQRRRISARAAPVIRSRHAESGRPRLLTPLLACAPRRSAPRPGRQSAGAACGTRQPGRRRWPSGGGAGLAAVPAG